MNQPPDFMHQNAAMVMQALVWHYAVPCFVAIVLLGLLAVAWSLIKSLFRHRK